MNRWMSTDVDTSGSTQFEGRTAEEAVARARAALGDSGALRCWKTRRGGVGGFFAREVFVAGLTPPPGSETTRGSASRAEPGQNRGAPERAPVAEGAPEDDTNAASGVGPVPRRAEDTSVWPEDHLAGLVEATSDQVSLGPLAIPSEAFDEVLAEAQAALTREREGNGVAVPRAPAPPEPQTAAPEEQGVSERQPVPPDGGHAEGPPNRRQDDIVPRSPESPRPEERPAGARPAGKATRPKAKARRTPPAPRSSAATHGQRGRPALMPDLRPGLRSLGVPAAYVPRGQRPSLDQLVSVMETLPVPPALPSDTSAVVAVVGSDRHLDRTVDIVVAELSLGQRDVLRIGGTPGAALVRPADVSAEGTRLGRQIAWRQAAGRTSLVVVRTEPGMPLAREARRLLDQAAPDYVLAAVDAACKRVDVEHWLGELLRVDALALWDLSGTRTPAELLGVLPIAFVDGEPSSSLGWTLALAGRAIDRGGR
jgi:hypothetical protein